MNYGEERKPKCSPAARGNHCEKKAQAVEEILNGTRVPQPEPVRTPTVIKRYTVNESYEKPVAQVSRGERRILEWLKTPGAHFGCDYPYDLVTKRCKHCKKNFEK